MESIARLESEKSDQMNTGSQEITGQGSVQQLELSETCRNCDETMRVSAKTLTVSCFFRINAVRFVHDELHHRLYILEQLKTVFVV